MKVNTKYGVATIDINIISMAEQRETNYGDEILYEVHLFQDNSPINMILVLNNKDDAVALINAIENQEASSGIIENIEKPKTYIDGFKDGCEYTLKLQKEK